MLLFCFRRKYRNNYSFFRTPSVSSYFVDLIHSKCLIHPLRIFLKSISHNYEIYFGFYTHSIGHTLQEFDYLFQIITENQKRKIVIFEKSPFTKEVKALLEKMNIVVIDSGYINYIFGLLYYKLQDLIHFTSLGHEFDYIRSSHLTTSQLIDKNNEYIKIRYITNSNKTIWEKVELNETILQQLNLGLTDKYVTIQIKTSPANQNLVKTDPELYSESLRKLVFMGYKIVLMGRENLPSVWKEFNIIDYANSENATFNNDLVLMKNSSLNLGTASGFCYLADMLHKPSIVVNGWQLTMPPYDNASVIIPQLLSKNGQLLTISKQLDLNYKFLTYKSEDIEYLLHTYEIVDIHPNLVLETVIDLLNKDYFCSIKSHPKIKGKFLGNKTLLQSVESNFSKAFIRNFGDHFFK
jgi:putative glycosyltransferase (TIGR04372 family)